MKDKIQLLFGLFLSCTSLFSQTILFQDDFEDGNAYDWNYRSGWEVILDDTNYVFEGQGHNWADSPTDFQSDITLQAKFKLISGSFHFNILFRSGRYFFPIGPDGIGFFTDPETAVWTDSNLDLNEWYSVRVVLENNNMQFFINDSLLFNYLDPSREVLRGKLAFECIDHIYVDDIVVKGEISNNQGSDWIRTGGPLGGIGYDVRIDPTDANIIYVTDNWAGVHKSYDGGKTWFPKNDGIYSRHGPTANSIPIFSLTVDPNDPNILWCGTFGMRGVYKSFDKGEHWHPKTNGIPNVGLTFRSFAVQPGNSNVVYCGVEIELTPDEIPVGQTSASIGKIYKTNDGGENWQEVLDSDALVRTIIIDPKNPDIVYAATGIFDRDDVKEEGVWKSIDAGSTWANINNGITNLTVGDIEMHPENPSILLAAAGRLESFGGGPYASMGELLRSTDGGLSWSQQYGNVMHKPFTYVEFDESNPNVVYAAASDRGFFKSTNGGLSFFETTYNAPYTQPGHIISITTHKDKPNWLITNSYVGGVFISEDGANSWYAASKGYTGCEIADMATAWDDPLKVWTVARSSIFMTDDGGCNWHGRGAMHMGFNDVPLGRIEMRAMALHPSNSNIVLSSSVQLYKTMDGGETWKTVFTPPVDDEITTIRFAPSDPQVVYLGYSVTGGFQIDRPIPFDPTNPSLGVLKSTNGGETWFYANNGLESTYKNITQIAIHPEHPDTAYIGTLNSGIYKTNDGGANWFQSSNGILVMDIRSIAIDPSNPNVIYAGAQRGGIYKTIDGGDNWVAINYGVDPEAAIRSIVIDPTNHQTVYAGDWLSGVYRSTDGGESWHHINEGLRTRAVQKLAISEDGSILYAGTQGEGVFRLALKQIPPSLSKMSHDTISYITIQKGDTLNLSVEAFDINNDSLFYTWKFDGTALLGYHTPSLCICSDTLELKDYLVELIIADSVSNIKIRWNISVVENTSYSSTYKYSGLKIYPNPIFGDLLYFDLGEKSNLKAYTLYNLSGQELMNMKYNGQQYIDFSSIGPGLFLLKFDYGNKSEIFKIIND